MLSDVFVDWLTVSQFYPEGGLPIISGGVVVHYDASGVPRFERNCSASLPGSFATSLRVACDGYRVSVSGNVGRFGRQDNLFNFGWEGTRGAVNGVLAMLDLPAFSVGNRIKVGQEFKWEPRGAVVSRLDITANYATGNEGQARAVIRWLAAKSQARMKKGRAGDESVWWANTRHMFKAYIKHLEMASHGCPVDDDAFVWCKDRGVVRVEIELKKRLLSDLGLNDWGDITQQKLVDLYRDNTEILRSVDRSNEPDLLDLIPQRSRVYASAWLDGRDLRDMCSRPTLFRHAKVLREYGIDLFAERENVKQFPVQVRVVEMVPLAVPDWYRKRAA